MLKINKGLFRQRVFVCFLPILLGFLILAFSLFYPANADQFARAGSSHPPRWSEFPVSEDGLTVDVYEHYILWAEEKDQYGSSCVKIYPTSRLPNPPLNSILDQAFDKLNLQPHGLVSDICLMDTQTGYIDYAFYPFSDTLDFQPRMDGDWIVFLRGRAGGQKTIVRNLITHDEIILARYSQVNVPNIHNNVVVYTDYPINSPGEVIYAYDLTANQEITISSCYSFCAGHPDVYNGIIVWHQNDSQTQDYNILGYDLTSQSYFTISDKPGDELSPRIDHDLVVWEWQTNIYGYDLKSGERLTITEAAGTQTRAAVSENLVVWMDWRDGSQYDIYALDLASNQEYQITTDNQWETNPAVWGNLIGYNTDPYGTYGARKLTEFSFQPIVSKP